MFFFLFLFKNKHTPDVCVCVCHCWMVVIALFMVFYLLIFTLRFGFKSRAPVRPSIIHQIGRLLKLCWCLLFLCILSYCIHNRIHFIDWCVWQWTVSRLVGWLVGLCDVQIYSTVFVQFLCLIFIFSKKMWKQMDEWNMYSFSAFKPNTERAER